MEIAQIRSMVDVLNYYGERDRDMDGQIETGEEAPSIVSANDTNGDNVLSSWEVLEAANRSCPTPIFSPQQIDTARYWNAFSHISLNIERSTMIQNIQYEAETLWFRGNMRLREGELSRDTLINGVRYMAGTRILLENGIVVSGTLAEETEIRGVQLSAGTYISTNGNRLIIEELTRNTRIHGILFPVGTRNIAINPDGRCAHAILPSSSSIIIDGISYAGGLYGIRFFGNGRLEIARLTQAAIIQEVSYPASSIIRYYENGRLASVELSQDTTIQSINFRRGATVYFNNEGWIERAELGRFSSDRGTQITQIQDIQFEGGEIVQFYSNGHIRSVNLSWDTLIQGIVFASGARSQFYNSGRAVNFFQNGRVRSGVLAQDSVIQGNSLLAGRSVEFNQSGTILLPRNFTTIENGMITRAETFTFNRGRITRRADRSFVFSAARADNPGFGILTNNYDLLGDDIVSFDIRGNLHGATLVVQIYDDEARDDLTPTISHRIYSTDINRAYSTIRIPLNGMVDHVRKIQFILVDGTTCQVNLRNIRFESGVASDISTLPEMDLGNMAHRSGVMTALREWVRVSGGTLFIGAGGGSASSMGIFDYQLDLSSGMLHRPSNVHRAAFDVSRESDPVEFRESVRSMLRFVRNLENESTDQSEQLALVEAYLVRLLNSLR